jgi:hypothetical protein
MTHKTQRIVKHVIFFRTEHQLLRLKGIFLQPKQRTSLTCPHGAAHQREPLKKLRLHDGDSYQ